MDEKDMIKQSGINEKAEGETLTEPAEEAELKKDLGSLASDTVHCVAAERERIERSTGERYNSAYESYSILTAALEKKNAVEKDLKDAVKTLWTAVKEEDDTTVAAYLKEIERVARASAGEWIHVAAIAQKAEASL